jgi:hypothetical protein
LARPLTNDTNPHRERQMAERFELIGTQGDISRNLRLAYGSAPDDLTPFVITLTPQYVARVLGKTLSAVPRYREIRRRECW